MIKLNNDSFKYVLSFVYNCNFCCTLNMNCDDIYNYLNILKVCKSFSHIRNKCHTIFSYNPPLGSTLRSVRECSIHCCKHNNKMTIINRLNRFKRKILKNVGDDLYELTFDNEKDTQYCLPYIKEYCKIAYVSESRKSIYVLPKNARYPRIYIL